MTLDPMQIAGGTAVLAAGVAGSVYLVRGGWRMFRKFDRILAGLEWIQAEMKPNGGGSLRDAIDGANNKIDAVNSKLESHLSEHARQPVQVNVGSMPPAQ